MDVEGGGKGKGKVEEKGRGRTNQKGTEGVPRWRPPSCRPRDGDMGSAYPGVNLIFLRKSTTESDVGPRIYPREYAE